MHPAVQNFRDLIVWQKAMALTLEVYKLTRQFPKEELYVLASQVRRAAISIPSNIAEGHARQGREYANYLSIARGSAAEVETQLLIAVQLEYIKPESIEVALGLLVESLSFHALSSWLASQSKSRWGYWLR